jgi:hypothetical protein
VHHQFIRQGQTTRPGLSCGILWWTKWRWGRFSPNTSVSPANFHSTNCSKNHLSSGLSTIDHCGSRCKGCKCPPLIHIYIYIYTYIMPPTELYKGLLWSSILSCIDAIYIYIYIYIITPTDIIYNVL